ncbi:MAG TPA: galactose oxidase-like domain-containing protein [Blastocatellia bacterium]|nr:galactose oxidase-like domain-containing protein [Blastocatellia bacterium]
MKLTSRISPRLFLSLLVVGYLVLAPFDQQANSNTAAKVTTGASVAQAAAYTQGQFSPVIDLPVVPIHTSVLPDGRVLFWGRDKWVVHGTPVTCCNSNYTGPDGLGGWKVGDEIGFVSASIWNPKTGSLESVNNYNTNLFCSGHSFLPDGRLFVTGGHGAKCQDGIGERYTNLFDPVTRTWAQGLDSSPNMSKGRWYPTNLTLPDGRTLILSGYRNNTPSGCPTFFTVNERPEIYNGATNFIQQLSPNSPIFPVYPHAFVAPDGRVFVAGPDNSYLWNINGGTDGQGGTGSYVALGSLAVAEGGQWRTVNHLDGSAVLYDANGKVLILGGRDYRNEPLRYAQVIDLNVINPSTGKPGWRQVASMNFQRNFPNSTLLPNGKVLVTGGTSCSGVWSTSCWPGAVRTAEMWDPVTETWSVMASHQKIRGYHATAVLLPDARVFLGGGGLPGSDDQGNSEVENRTYGEYNAEIYSPPYLFNPDGTLAQRPQILSAPQVVGYNEQFFISTSNPANVSRVVLVRLPSVTHGVNMDQRMNVLNFSVSGTSGLNLTAPANLTQCPPGPYMLFIFNNNGVPSEARVIRVSGPIVNVAVGKGAWQSSTVAGGSPSRAVDGNTSGVWGNGSVTHTDFNSQAWLQIDLGANYWIEQVRVWNRTDCCGERLSNFYVFVSDKLLVSTDLNQTLSQAGVSSYYFPGQAGLPTAVLTGRKGRYVRVQLAGVNYLSLAEVEVLARAP